VTGPGNEPCDSADDLSDDEFVADEFWAFWRVLARESARGWEPDPQVKEETLRRILAMPRAGVDAR